jgi:hypothetical protein
MDLTQQQLHQALAINTKYEKALNEILAAKTVEEAKAIAEKVLKA